MATIFQSYEVLWIHVINAICTVEKKILPASAQIDHNATTAEVILINFIYRSRPYYESKELHNTEVIRFTTAHISLKNLFFYSNS